jgi:hypothetical protein
MEVVKKERARLKWKGIGDKRGEEKQEQRKKREKESGEHGRDWGGG